MKDGGVFIDFSFDPDTPDPSNSLDEIYGAIFEKISSHGGLPWSMSLRTGRLWRVLGTPWKEDMRRFASRTLCIEFDGPDIREEQLWDILRVTLSLLSHFLSC